MTMTDSNNPVPQAGDNVLQPSPLPVKIHLKRSADNEVPPPPPPPPMSEPIRMVQPVLTPSPVAMRMGSMVQKVVHVEEEPKFKFCPYCNSTVPIEKHYCNCGWNFFHNMPEGYQLNATYNKWHKSFMTIIITTILFYLLALLASAVRFFSVLVLIDAVVLSVAAILNFVFSRILIYKYHLATNTLANGCGIKLFLNMPPLLASLLTIVLPIWEIASLICLEINQSRCLKRAVNLAPAIFFSFTCYLGWLVLFLLKLLVIKIAVSLGLGKLGGAVVILLDIVYLVFIVISIQALHTHLQNSAEDIMRKYQKFVNLDRRQSAIAGE